MVPLIQAMQALQGKAATEAVQQAVDNLSWQITQTEEVQKQVQQEMTRQPSSASSSSSSSSSSRQATGAGGGAGAGGAHTHMQGSRRESRDSYTGRSRVSDPRSHKRMRRAEGFASASSSPYSAGSHSPAHSYHANESPSYHHSSHRDPRQRSYR